MIVELPPPVVVLDARIHPLTRTELANAIASWAASGQKKRVYNVNVHAMNLRRSLVEFAAALDRADLLYCDGVGVQMAGRILGSRIPERLTVLDWFDLVLAELQNRAASVYLIGDKPDVVQGAAEQIGFAYPDLRVTGYHHGFFQIDGSEEVALLEQIARAQPAVTFVGMGMPRQELWIEDRWERLPDSVYIPVGAAFTWYSGARKRPPRWMRAVGLEWLGRLLSEPKRLGRRYLLGNPRFIASVLDELRTGTRHQRG